MSIFRYGFCSVLLATERKHEEVRYPNIYAILLSYFSLVLTCKCTVALLLVVNRLC